MIWATYWGNGVDEMETEDMREEGTANQNGDEFGNSGDDCGENLLVLSSSSTSESEDSILARWRKFQEKDHGKLAFKQRMRKIRREMDEYLAPGPDESAPGEDCSHGRGN